MRKNTFILKLICCVLIVSSCSKNEEFDASNTSSKTLITDPSNLLNPFDYYGVIHNEALSEFIETTELTYLSSTSNFTTEINGIILNNANFVVNFDSSNAPISDMLIEPYIDGFPENLNSISSETQLGATAKNYLNGLYTHLNEIINGNEISHSAMHDYILSLEDTILNDTSLYGDDREYVLGITSISRHSFYYWNEYQKNNVSKGNPYRWWQWVVVGAADAMGAAVGATIPEPTGTTILTGATVASGLGFAWMDHVSDRK